jgi:hypothetical protein
MVTPRPIPVLNRVLWRLPARWKVLCRSRFRFRGLCWDWEYRLRDCCRQAQGTLHFLRQFNHKKVTGGIEIIFSGFVDDAEIFGLFGLLIRQYPINLAFDEVFTPAIFQTDGELKWNFGFQTLIPKIKTYRSFVRRRGRDCR